MPAEEHVSPWLADLRRELGMTQAQLGAYLDVTANTVARWERGERRVRHPAMLRLALEALRGRSAGSC